MENQSGNEAREALSAIGDARAAAAERLVAPWWYYPVLGLLAAGAVLMASLGNVFVFLGTLWVFTVGLGVLMGLHRERTGLWIPAFRSGRASRWAWLLLATYAVCVPAAIIAGRLASTEWAAWLAAVVLFAATAVAGSRFNEALQAQLREAP